MILILLISLFLLQEPEAIPGLPPTMPVERIDSVYVCLGDYAYAYHRTETCSCIQPCRDTIVKLDIYQVKYFRKKCKCCYDKIPNAVGK